MVGKDTSWKKISMKSFIKFAEILLIEKQPMEKLAEVVTVNKSIVSDYF